MKFILLTDKDGVPVVVNAAEISTVESCKTKDAYGKQAIDPGSVVTMANTYRLVVKQAPALVAMEINAGS